MASFVFDSPYDENNQQMFRMNIPSTPTNDHLSFKSANSEGDVNQLERNHEEQYLEQQEVGLTTPIADDINTPANISSADRRRQEMEESERLAWQLMEEESMRAYEMQLDYMRSHPELFSEEEVQALNSVLQENVAVDEDIEEGEGEIEDEEGNSGTWSYDQLLEIARVVGGKRQSEESQSAEHLCSCRCEDRKMETSLRSCIRLLTSRDF
jgi:hypothetical protein